MRMVHGQQEALRPATIHLNVLLDAISPSAETLTDNNNGWVITDTVMFGDGDQGQIVRLQEL